jgi:MinD superfamily P-loop ATPase
MKQIVIVSGKGGTGKTVITGAFAALAENKVMVDCDVDAPDLYLLLNPDIKEKYLFKSGYLAVIDESRCVKCKKCSEICRFEAINADFKIDPFSCEGCGFCSHICPVRAINLQDKVSGEWFISETKYGHLVHAKLGVAEANSGKLVSLIRKRAITLAENKQYDWIIIDGSPGIGCPVIASISNTNCAVIVTEPTLSGLHDAERVIQVARHFKIPVKMIINKYDLNLKITQFIKKYCTENKIPLIGEIPFDGSIVDSVVQRKTIMEFSNAKMQNLISQIWHNVTKDI